MKAPVVVKIGGSLFHSPQLKSQLVWIIRECGGQPSVIVAGGGVAANDVRAWQSIHGLDDLACHWLAIRAMGLGERLLLSLLESAIHASSPRDLDRAADASLPVILDTESMLRASEGQGLPTPEPSWSFTSDSLAAWAAHRIGAQRLILAKSVDRPRGDASRAACDEHVDKAFPAQSAGLQVDWVNLKDDVPEIVRWL
jgi:dihydroneopterin aldolase